MNKRLNTFACTLMVAGLIGCGGGSSSDDTIVIDDPVPTLEPQIRQFAFENGAVLDPSDGLGLPKISEPLPQLGMQLFFSKSLGGELDSACVSCHHPLLGGGDDLSLPIGVGAVDPNFLGPGRMHDATAFEHDGGPTIPRNSPTTFNMGYWDKSVFHDGRINAVVGEFGSNGDDGFGIQTPDEGFKDIDPKAINLTQAQAMFPVISQDEMRGLFEPFASNEDVRDALALRLANQSIANNWLEQFQIAFEQPEGTADTLITYDNIAMALAEYERSQSFVKTPFQAFLNGDDDAISDSAKQGAMLFYQGVDNGGAGCAACHNGSIFTDEGFHVIATPQLGRGKNNGLTKDNDFGRFNFTKGTADTFAFRTPSLVNVTETAPYGHAGAFATLKEVIVHHLDPAQSVATYDYTASALQPGIQTDNAQRNTQDAMAELEVQMTAGTSLLKPAALTDDEIDDLIAFIESLTDPCTQNAECLADWIPSDQTPDPDGMRLEPSNSF
ncbi:cytochrome-c peroxidase [Echinimonas agarilytica]|uniref:Cytochrome-c peroxidase n=1 Tax=Echinimonas agarilytica TaxID=1215918 RepID=A0AA42B7S3_9GAMM|nr:cytochrome c peroxidase [Echinimonas agarilytica]MCM2680500.1 cytochrome-c peroxidase [Echinimonas agarilytica]